MHPHDRDRAVRQIKTDLAGGAPCDSEFRVIWQNGETHTIRSLATMVLDAAGDPVRIIGTDWDVSEIRLLGEQLREEKEALTSSEARYRALTEGLPQLVWVIDAASRFDYVNARWLAYTGLSLEASSRLGFDGVVAAADARESRFPWTISGPVTARLPITKISRSTRSRSTRSFGRDIAEDTTDQAIAKTIITLAHSLGMRVVAEGVETQAQLEILESFDVDSVQGYLFSRPLCAADFERFLEESEQGAGLRSFRGVRPNPKCSTGGFGAAKTQGSTKSTLTLSGGGRQSEPFAPAGGPELRTRVHRSRRPAR